MRATNAIALAFGRRTLSAVAGAVSQGAISITSILDVDLPSTLDRDDPAAAGAWIKEQLRRADFPRGEVTIALPREQLGLKRLVLPSVDQTELPEMIRLALQRDLPFDADGAVIDFVPCGRTETSTSVIAVAAPRPLLDSAQKVARAAGLSPERMTMREMGALTLIRTAALPDARRVLAIDVTEEGVKFGVFIDGAITFSRAAALPSDLSEADVARAVMTEARRTWMSYRMSEGSQDVQRAVLFGHPGSLTDVAGRVSEMLKVPCQSLEYHPLVQEQGRAFGALWPLAGLLLDAARGEPSIDFLHPRTAPDVNARRRLVALAGIGGAALLVAGSIMVALVQGKKLEAQYTALRERARQAEPLRLRYKRDRLKLAHLEQWQQVDVDWLDHMEALATFAPSPELLVLDEWSGVLDFRGVAYSQAGGWTAPKGLRITVEGEARDREIADAFRAALVESDLYTTSSTGADREGGRRLPVPFTYTLRTDQGQVPGAASAAPSPGEGGP